MRECCSFFDAEERNVLSRMKQCRQDKDITSKLDMAVSRFPLFFFLRDGFDADVDG